MGEWYRKLFEENKQQDSLSKGTRDDRPWYLDTSCGRRVSKLDNISCEFLVNLANKWKIPCDLSAAVRCVETDQLFQLTAVPSPQPGPPEHASDAWLVTALWRDSEPPGAKGRPGRPGVTLRIYGNCRAFPGLHAKWRISNKSDMDWFCRNRKYRSLIMGSKPVLPALVLVIIKTRPCVQQCQAQGLVFSPWFGLIQDRIRISKTNRV